jgi:hypothetical protein
MRVMPLYSMGKYRDFWASRSYMQSQYTTTSSIIKVRDGFTGGCTPLALARGGGGAIFHDKAKNYLRQNEIQ